MRARVNDAPSPLRLGGVIAVGGIGWALAGVLSERSAFVAAGGVGHNVLVVGAAMAPMLLAGLALVALTLHRRNRSEWARLEAEQETRRSQLFLDSLVENIPDMIFVKDATALRFERVNRAGEELLGYSRDELLGKNDYDLFPRDEADFFTQKDREVLAHGRLEDISEEPVQTRHKGQRILHTKKLPILDEAGNPRYLLGISEDVTERKKAERAIERAREEAERANQAKSEFISRISHELRTPLNAILGFGQLLAMDELSPDQQESVQQVLRGGRHLLGLINEVLDISRIETGNLALSPEAVSVQEVLDETLGLIQPLATERAIHVRAPEPRTCPWNVQADRQRLKQVLLNLASNAVKYNRPAGTITFSCEQTPDGAVRIGVADTGPGIPPERLARLYTPFDRLGAEGTGVEGTGIGLALSKGLTELMGGSLDVRTEAGAGTTFSVVLAAAVNPLAAYAAGTDDAPAADEPPADGSTGTVLYVEDNPSNLRLVELILDKRAVRLVTTAEGRRVQDLAHQHAPDIVLLDLHLPDMSGEEVLRRLREDPATATVPVVVISADATAGQVERLLAAGAQEYLTKPIDVDRLLGLVDELLAGARR